MAFRSKGLPGGYPERQARGLFRAGLRKNSHASGSTLHLRPTRPDDDVKVLELLQHMSTDALYYRFMSVPRVDLEQAAKLARPSFDRDYVLVGECAGALAALAGYYRTDSTFDRAEIAFAVADAWQGRGIGTRMLECLAEIGRARGIRAFDAYVLGDNRRMMDVFLECGFTETQKIEHGVFHVSLLLDTSPRFSERAADRWQAAAAASMRPFFEPQTSSAWLTEQHTAGQTVAPACFRRDSRGRSPPCRIPGTAGSLGVGSGFYLGDKYKHSPAAAPAQVSVSQARTRVRRRWRARRQPPPAGSGGPPRPPRCR